MNIMSMPPIVVPLLMMISADSDFRHIVSNTLAPSGDATGCLITPAQGSTKLPNARR